MERATPPVGRFPAALAGLLAVAVTLGVAELVAAFVPAGRSFVIAVGDVVIDLVPGWLERAVISTLGRNDKPFLIANVTVVSALLGAGLGIVAARRFLLGAAGLALMGGVAVAATLSDPRTGVGSAITTGVVGVGAGILVLAALLRVARPRVAPAAAVEAGPEPIRNPAAGAVVDRTRFVQVAALAVLVSGAGAYGGRLKAAGKRVESIRKSIRLPKPARPAPPAPPGASLEIQGLSPLYVPNRDFYRIDTALLVPQVDPDGWALEVKGMVDRPFRLTYAELLALPQVEADVTLSCVSNEVGGGLVGNARWQGVPLSDLLERARVRSDATQLLGRSVDGFTAGFPVELALDGRDAIVAVGMNGQPLPAAHGFPARIVVPGLYGYVSATKWLASIELNRFDQVDGYWIPRGWSKEGPIKTQSRIDVVTRELVAGVAWAPTRGIERVEVKVDDEPWQDATLATALSEDTWRQWVLRRELAAGRHQLAVRATDGTGRTQTAERTPVAPSGATGHHTVEVQIS